MLNTKQQGLLLSLWLSDDKLFTKTVGILKPEYFAPEWRKAVTFIRQYYNDYNGIPTRDVISSSTDVDIKNAPTLTNDQRRYTEDQIETFCKQSALKRIIIENSPELIQTENYGKLEALIREAITIKVDSNIGIKFFEGLAMRQSQPESQTIRYSLGYPDIDREMDGGIARKEMLLVLAISGGGKSVSILNYAINLMRERDPRTQRFLNTLYISLELPETMIDKRSQMIVAAKNSLEVGKYQDEVREIVDAASKSSGEMIIKKLRLGSTANDLRALIKEVEIQTGWLPDVIVLDYLDKMYPNANVSTENIGMRDKFITEEFYDVLDEFDAIGLTASQLVKGAADVEVYNQSHQAGGAEKTRSSDWVQAIHLTDAMRAAGQIGFQFLKTRSSDGVGKTVNLGWEAKTLRITNPKGKNFANHIKQPPTSDERQSTPSKSSVSAMDQLMDMF